MVRAKMVCTGKQDRTGEDQGVDISLMAVYANSPENAEWSKFTPSGSLTMNCVNENASSQFDVGREYYIDFTPCEVIE